MTKLNVAQNSFYGLNNDEVEGASKNEQVNSVICSMLPQLTTLNNRQLALGKEKKESRKKHYEEKQGGKSEKKEKTEVPSKQVEKKSKKKGVEKKSESVKEVSKKGVEKKSESVKEVSKKSVEEVSKQSIEETPNASATIDDTPQSGVLEVEDTKATKTNTEEVANFLIGKNNEEELDGWD